MILPVAVVCFGLAPLPAGPAATVAARPSRPVLPVSVTASTTAGWHTGEGARGELFGRLNVASALDRWRFAARLDTATFTSGPDDRYTLEKASVEWSNRSLSLTAGDAYVSIGRGLALSLRKDDELGTDTTLRGAKLLVHHGDLGATLVAGTANPNNVDEATGASIDDPYDLIAGAQADVRLADRVKVGGYATAIAFHDSMGLVPGDAYADRSLQVGVTVDAPRIAERFGFYLEAVRQQVVAEPAPADPVGFGLYGAATAYLGKATLLFEGKAYGTLTPLGPDTGVAAFDSIAYTTPPTVERVGQLLENPQRRIAGGRLRLDWRFGPALGAHASYGAFRDWQGYADPMSPADVRPGTIHDPYAGFEARWNDARSWAMVTGGYRAVLLDGPAELVRGDGHLEADIAQALDRRWSLTLHATHLERSKDDSQLAAHAVREGTVSAGFRLRPWLAAAAGYDYTTDPTQPERDYFHGDVSWDITSSSSLRLFAGSARGGLRCVSGVCRVFPPFEGVKLTATLRF